MRPPLPFGESFINDPDIPAEALGFDPILIFMDEPDPSKTSSLASALAESLSCADRARGVQHMAVETHFF